MKKKKRKIINALLLSTLVLGRSTPVLTRLRNDFDSPETTLIAEESLLEAEGNEMLRPEETHAPSDSEETSTEDENEDPELLAQIAAANLTKVTEETFQPAVEEVAGLDEESPQGSTYSENLGIYYIWDATTRHLEITGGDFKDQKALYQHFPSVQNIEFTGSVTAAELSTYLFWNLTALTAIEGIENLDTSNVRDMSSMFYDASSLQSLDLSSFNTSSVQYMYHMFWGASSLQSLNLSSFDTSNVQYTNQMFNGTTALETLILGENTNITGSDLPEPAGNRRWVNEEGTIKSSAELMTASSTPANTAGTWNLRTVGTYHTSLGIWHIWDEDNKHLEITGGAFNDFVTLEQSFSSVQTIEFTGSVTAGQNSNGLFGGLSDLATIKGIENLDTSKVQNMSYMFYGASSLQSLDLSSFNTSNVQYMHLMFQGTTALETLILGQNTRIVGSDLPEPAGNRRWVNENGVIKSSAELMKESSNPANTAGTWNLRTVGTYHAGLGIWYIWDEDNNHLEITGGAFGGSHVLFEDERFSSVQTIEFTGSVTAAQDSSDLFFNLPALTAIEGIENLDTSNVTNMSSMFYGASSLKSLDLSSFNIAKVQYMNNMFNGASSLQSLNLSSFDTSNINFVHTAYMLNMFYNTPALETLILGEKTRIDGSGLLEPTGNRRWVNENGVIKSSAELMSASSTPANTAGTWRLQNVWNGVAYTWDEAKGHLTFLGGAFASGGIENRIADMPDIDATSIETIEFSGAVTAYTNSSYLFASLTKLTQIKGLDKLDTSEVTNMNSMFFYTSSLESLDLSGFDTSKVTNMAGMFTNSKLRSLDLSYFDTLQVETMAAMFYGAENLQSLDLSSFNTSNVTAMYDMFGNTWNLQSLDLSSFDTSSVKNMRYMFRNTTSLQSLDLSEFDTSSVTNMDSMFSGASALQSLDLSSFDTSIVTNMSSMFNGASNLQSLNLSNFDTSTVLNTYRDGMFFNTDALDTLILGANTDIRNSSLPTKESDWVNGNLSLTSHELMALSAQEGGAPGTWQLSAGNWQGISYVWDYETQHLQITGGTFNDGARLHERFPTAQTIEFTNAVTAAQDSSYLFYNLKDLTSITGLEKLNTSSTTDMIAMFGKTLQLTVLDLTGFDTANVTNMSLMFSGSGVQNLNISSFEIGYFTSKSYMFSETHLTTLTLGTETNISDAVLPDLGNQRWVNNGIIKQSAELMKDSSNPANTAGTWQVYDFWINDHYREHAFAYHFADGHLNIVAGTFSGGGRDNSRLSTFFEERILNNATITSLEFSGPVKGIYSMYGAFSDLQLESLTGLNHLDLSGISDFESMFEGLDQLTELDLTGINTSSATYMTRMFYGMSSLEALDLTDFDMDRVKDKYDMLYGTTNLTSLTLGEKTNIAGTGLPTTENTRWFRGNEALTSYDLMNLANSAGTWERRAVDVWEGIAYIWHEDDQRLEILGGAFNASVYLSALQSSLLGNDIKTITFTGEVSAGYFASNLFANLTSLEKIEGLDLLDTSKVTDMTNMFANTESLKGLDLTQFNTQSATHMQYMFSGSGVEKIKFGADFGETAIYMMSMFQDTSNLQSLDLTPLNVQNVEDMSLMFSGSAIEQIEFDAGFGQAAVNMSNLFGNTKNLETLDLSNFDTQNVETMREMFFNSGASKITFGPNFGEAATDMSRMFYGTQNLTTLDLMNLSTQSADSMSEMFANSGLSEITFSPHFGKNATTMDAMFENTGNLKALDLTQFETQNVAIMSYMFSNSGIESLDISSFDMSDVQHKHDMLAGTTTLISLTLGEKTNIAGTGLPTTENTRWFRGNEALTSYDLMNLANSAGTWERRAVGEWEGITYIWHEADQHLEILGGVINDGAYLEALQSSLLEDFIKTITFTGDVIAAADSSFLFSSLYSLEEINGLDLLNTSLVTHMNYMFADTPKLSSLDLGQFDTQNVVKMNTMFQSSGVENIIFSDNFGTSAESMYEMFAHTPNLKALNLAQFNTQKVVGMGSMFDGSGIEEINFSENFGAAAEDMRGMFANTPNLKALNLAQFNTQNVEDMSFMFNASGIEEVSFSDDFGAAAEEMENMFANTENLKALNLAQFDTQNVVLMSSMFYASGIEEVSFSDDFGAAAEEMREMFAYTSNLKTLDLAPFNTQKVTDMHSMFYNSGVKEITFSENFGSAAIDMGEMFAYTLNLQTLDLTFFNTQKVEYMDSMFSSSGVEEINFSENFGGAAKDMSWMFYVTSNLQTLDLTSFNTQNVENMFLMFAGSGVQSLDISSFDMSNVEVPSYMFSEANDLVSLKLGENTNIAGSELPTLENTRWVRGNEALTSDDLMNLANSAGTWERRAVGEWEGIAYIWDSERQQLNILGGAFNYGAELQNLQTNLESDILEIVFTGSVKAHQYSGYLFYNLTLLTALEGLNWLDTSEVVDMAGMFRDLSSLETLDLSDFDTQNVENMAQMFYGVSSLETLDLSSFDTSKVMNMRYMFQGMNALQELNISSFITENVTDMSWMFYQLNNLQELDLSGFNTEKVENMAGMFFGLSSLTALNLETFNTEAVTSMGLMFAGMQNLETLDISHFDTKNVKYMDSMFASMQSLEALDLSHFNTENVTHMNSMFSVMINLRNLDVSGFDTSKVTNMSYMFMVTPNLNTLELTNFDTENVTDMSYMFIGSGVQSLDISSFDMSNVSDKTNMLANTTLTSLILGEDTNIAETGLPDGSPNNWIHAYTLATGKTSAALMESSPEGTWLRGNHYVASGNLAVSAEISKEALINALTEAINVQNLSADSAVVELDFSNLAAHIIEKYGTGDALELGFYTISYQLDINLTPFLLTFNLLVHDADRAVTEGNLHLRFNDFELDHLQREALTPEQAIEKAGFTLIHLADGAETPLDSEMFEFDEGQLEAIKTGTELGVHDLDFVFTLDETDFNGTLQINITDHHIFEIEAENFAVNHLISSEDLLTALGEHLTMNEMTSESEVNGMDWSDLRDELWESLYDEASGALRTGIHEVETQVSHEGHQVSVNFLLFVHGNTENTEFPTSLVVGDLFVQFEHVEKEYSERPSDTDTLLESGGFEISRISTGETKDGEDLPDFVNFVSEHTDQLFNGSEFGEHQIGFNIVDPDSLISAFAEGENDGTLLVTLSEPDGSSDDSSDGSTDDNQNGNDTDDVDDDSGDSDDSLQDDENGAEETEDPSSEEESDDDAKDASQNDEITTGAEYADLPQTGNPQGIGITLPLGLGAAGLAALLLRKKTQNKKNNRR